MNKNIKGYIQMDDLLVVVFKDGVKPTNDIKGIELGESMSDYIYKFNILTEYSDAVILTNDPNKKETKDDSATKYYVTPSEEFRKEIIEQRKKDLISFSKDKLSDFLKTPIGLSIKNHSTGFYNVTKEKQDQMFQTLSSYRTQKEFFPDAKILWNKSGEELEEWSEEDFMRLIREVNEHVQPRVKKQQKYEKDILAATTLEELDLLEDDINYKEVT